MSVADNIKKAAAGAAEAIGIEPVIKLLEQIPSEALAHIATILQGAAKAKDPVRYLKRIAVAQAAHTVTKAALNR